MPAFCAMQESTRLKLPHSKKSSSVYASGDNVSFVQHGYNHSTYDAGVNSKRPLCKWLPKWKTCSWNSIAIQVILNSSTSSSVRVLYKAPSSNGCSVQDESRKNNNGEACGLAVIFYTKLFIKLKCLYEHQVWLMNFTKRH